MPTPLSGFGLGMRRPHYAAYLAGDAPVDFVEVISENFMVEGGRPLDTLLRVREHYPVALHGVSLSVGSADGPSIDYLDRLKTLVERIDPAVVSDHLCWTGVGGFNSHDLLPVPLTDEALDTVCRTIDRAQSHLGRRMLFENPSSYIAFPGTITEWDMRHTAPNQGERNANAATQLDLAQTVRESPSTKILSLNGYYDLATPFFQTEFDLSHMLLDPGLKQNLQIKYYPSGHMVYLNPEALTKLKSDLVKFYGATSG